MGVSSPAAPPARPKRDYADAAYLLPMGTFLALTWVSAQVPDRYAPTWFPLIYTLKTFATAAVLLAFRRQYTPIRWNWSVLGMVVGAVGIVQWIAMQLVLQKHFAFFRPSGTVFNPLTMIASPLLRDGYITVRMLDAVIVVPFMEELFWRDYLWRSILAPNDFKLARVGEWGWTPFLIVAAAFGTVHGNWWLTAIVWALLVNTLLATTKSLGACIWAHAISNLLLGGYVLWTHDWSFW